MARVHFGDEVELGSPIRFGVTARHLDVSNSIRAVHHRRLIFRRKKSRTVNRWSAKILSAHHRDEARQVLVLAAQTVIKPGTDAGPRARQRTSESQIIRRGVNWTLVAHGADDAEIIIWLCGLLEKI